MKRAMMLGAMLGWLHAAGAQAQIPVTDGAANLQLIKTYLQDLKGYATQLQQLQQEVQTAMATVQTVESLVQNPNLGTAMTLMSRVGITNPLPLNPYAVQGLISGRTSPAGLPTLLSSLVTTQGTTNSIYTCTNGSWACEQQIAAARGIAGSQGIALGIIQQLSDHIPVLQALRDNLATATTPAQRENAMAAIQSEQVWTANAAAQMQSAMMLAAAERDNRAQREDELITQSIENELAEARARGMIQ